MIPSLSLPAPYAAALEDALAYLHKRYHPLGVIVSGTIVRGAPHASSDLDFMIIHEPA